MKRFYLLLFAILLFSHCIYAQSLSVSSFRKLDNSMTARIDAPKKDKNGDVCAVIKIVTSQTGFTFEGDGAGIFGSEYKNGEYWVWVGYGANRLTIKHSQLGVLRDYIYPISIQKASDYELVLITGKIVTTLVEEIESKWLLITSTPKNAMIYLDNVFAGIGTAQKKLKPGKYEYRIEAPFYHNAVGKIEIKEENVTQSIQLQAAFGFLQISSLPEDGATIMIDGKQINTNTPAKTDTLMSGEHLVTIAKQMFQPSSQKVMIKDNETTPITLTMLPNFAEVEITAPNDATIWIDNNNKATGLWQGRLDAGIYTIEARKDKHITHKKDIEAKAGEKLNIELNPTPQYGKLNIVTEPPMAIITINGKNYGTTPTTIKDLLIGNYNVELSLKGFATINEKTTISEGKTSNINTKLTNGKEVTISSNPSNSKLYINNKYIGMTPYTCNLSYGNYNLQIEKNKQIEKKVMLLSQTSESNINLVIGKEVIINSTPLNAYLFIDNEYVGKTPYSNKLSYGNHELRIENEGKKNEKNITITQNMRKNIFTLSIPTTPQLGQKYQGGIVSYILKWRDIGYDPNIPHGIIVAPYDQSIGVKWDNDDLTTGAIDTNIGSGKANTDKIVSCQGLGNYAAKLCFDLKLNGYNDWYLPSKGELNQLYINRSLINGFSQNSYWSSSNYNSNYAWLQSFENGYQYTNYKTSLSSVRAIRRF